MASTVEGCVELMRALVPGFEPSPLESLEELAVGVAWLDERGPARRARASRTRRRTSRAGASSSSRSPPTTTGSSCARSPTCTARSSPRTRTSTATTCAARSSAASPSPTTRSPPPSGSAPSTASGAAAALDGVDLLVTPTIGFVAPPADVDELTIRERGIRFTYPFDSLGWPALALPCGPAEDGFPASIQLVGRPGDDSRVLAAGRLLASLIRGTAAGVANAENEG